MWKLLILTAILGLPVSAMGIELSDLRQSVARGQFEKAVKTGQELLKHSPDDTQALFLTGFAHQKLGQEQKAVRLYRQLIRLKPNLPEPRNNLALIYLQQGQPDQAIDLLIESLNTHPAYATAWRNLSNLYQGLASEAYRRALSGEQPNSSENDMVSRIELTALDRIYEGDSTLQPVQMATIDPQPALTDSAVLSPSQETPTAQTQPAVSDSPPSDDTKTQLQDALNDWARAWSSKDFDAYLQAYSDDYKGGKDNHSQWVDFRRSRVLKPGQVTIAIDSIRILSSNSENAVIDFDQHYHSSSYSDRVRKRIDLRKFGNHWKIVSERTLAVL